MNKPSSTITAAALAGAGVTFIWALVDNFSAISVSATVVSSSTALIAAIFGYYKKENVIKQPVAKKPLPGGKKKKK